MARYDDRDEIMKFTGLSDGDWNRLESTDGSTITSTNIDGARGSVSFTGSWIGLYGAVPIGKSGACVFFQVDNLPAERQCRQSNHVYRNQELWFQSSTLEPGAHMLTWTYERDVELFQVDYVSVYEDEMPPAPPATSVTEAGTPTPSVTADSESTAAAPTTQTSVSSPASTNSRSTDTATDSQTRVDGSSTDSVPTGSNGQSTNVIQTHIRSSASNALAAESSESPILHPGVNDLSSESASKALPVGAIVGGALGVTALLSFLILLCLFLRRKRKQRLANLHEEPKSPLTPFNVVEFGQDSNPEPNGTLGSVSGDNRSPVDTRLSGSTNVESLQPNRRDGISVGHQSKVPQSPMGSTSNDMGADNGTQPGVIVDFEELPNTVRDDREDFSRPRSEISSPPSYVTRPY